MISFELNQEQSRKVTVEHIANMLIIMKQYMDDCQIAKYKYMIGQFGILSEIDQIAESFDRAWPTDVKWGNI